MWEKRREPNLSRKGTVAGDPRRVRVAGGRDVPFIPIVTITNQAVDLWFESVRIDGRTLEDHHARFDFGHVAGSEAFGPTGLRQFDIDAWVHASDGQLKICILDFPGDGISDRGIAVLRTGYYYNDLT